MDTDVASSSGGEGKKGKRSGGETVIVDSGRRRSSCGYCSSSYSSISHGSLLTLGYCSSSYSSISHGSLLTLGYCSSSYSSISHGVWAYSLTAEDYQDLLDRGWRRSGCYVYKPEMNKTCCPQYTIRLKAANFTPSKEQDRVLKKMQRYLDGTLDPKIEKSKEKSNPESSSVPVPVPESQDNLLSLISDEINHAINTIFKEKNLPLTNQTPKPVVKKVKPHMKQKLKEEDLIYTCNVSFHIAAYLKKIKNNEGMETISISPSTIADELAGAISSNHENIKIPNLIIKACNGHINFYSSDVSSQEPTQNYENAPQDAINNSTREPKTNYENAPGKKKSLEIRMKRSEFDPEEYALYAKYQTVIHKDKKISKESYTRFLVDTPINPNPNSSPAPPCGFGSFHQQYLIDGRLMAVGVVDILRKCLSSKYLFWDPDLAFLSLGKFSALKEILWVREMREVCPELEYYYLGYYIHSCAKMRYKASYQPSELLCPLRYEWVPYDIARPLLDKSKYAVLSDYNKQESTQLLTTGDENGDENGEESDELMNDVDDEEAEFTADMDDDDDDVAEDGSSTDSIGEIMLDVQNTRIKYKDLQKVFVINKGFLPELEKQLHRYVKVVGQDLSRRIVFSLG